MGRLENQFIIVALSLSDREYGFSRRGLVTPNATQGSRTGSGRAGKPPHLTKMIPPLGRFPECDLMSDVRRNVLSIGSYAEARIISAQGRDEAFGASITGATIPVPLRRALTRLTDAAQREDGADSFGVHAHGAPRPR